MNKDWLVPIPNDKIYFHDKKIDYRIILGCYLFSMNNMKSNNRYIRDWNLASVVKQISELVNLSPKAIKSKIKYLAHIESNEFQHQFDEDGGYLNLNTKKFVPIRNTTVEYLLKNCSHNAIKIYILLNWLTKYKIKITYEVIMRYTNIKSRATISKALKELDELIIINQKICSRFDSKLDKTIAYKYNVYTIL